MHQSCTSVKNRKENRKFFKNDDKKKHKRKSEEQNRKNHVSKSLIKFKNCLVLFYIYLFLSEPRVYIR